MDTETLRSVREEICVDRERTDCMGENGSTAVQAAVKNVVFYASTGSAEVVKAAALGGNESTQQGATAEELSALKEVIANNKGIAELYIGLLQPIFKDLADLDQTEWEMYFKEKAVKSASTILKNAEKNLAKIIKEMYKACPTMEQHCLTPPAENEPEHIKFYRMCSDYLPKCELVLDHVSFDQDTAKN